MRRLRSLLARALTVPAILLFLLIWGAVAGPIRWYGNLLTGASLSFVVLLAIGAAFFFFTLWLAGPHVLPIDPRSRHERSAARRVLRRFALGVPTLMAVVQEAQVRPGPNGENRDHVSGAGVIDIDSTSLVVLATPGEISRIEGQRVIFTDETEWIKSTIDLRIQLRTDVFEFITRDGILIKARVTVRFQIDQAHFVKVPTVDPALRWPRPIVWTPRTVKRALSLESISPQGQSTRWDAIPLGVAAGNLRAIIAEYTFDELSEPLEPRKDPRAEIRSRLQTIVRQRLAPHGINVLTVAVGVFFPKDFSEEKTFPDKTAKPDATSRLDPITQQRVRAWRAEWESRRIQLQAEADAEANRRRDLARTQAQMELIMRVTQALEQGAPITAENQDQVARRFLETLQKMANEPYTRELLADDNLQILGLIAPRDQADQRGTSTEVA